MPVPGVYWYGYGTQVPCAVTNAALVESEQGTQRVCVGVAYQGDGFQLLSYTNVVVNLVGGFQALGIARGNNDFGAFGFGEFGGCQTDAGRASDHDDFLALERHVSSLNLFVPAINHAAPATTITFGIS